MKVFKDCRLRITIQANLRIGNFLDVQVNLDTSTYQPYLQSYNNSVYLNKNSNHSTTVLKQLLKSIGKRISDMSSNQNVFTHSIPIYIYFIKIFNKNTWKVSCSCMGNMASIISSHNRTILNPDVSLEYGCNCRSRNEFLLQNKCLTPKIVYCANVENDINVENNFYFGVSETPFKESFRNHKKEFNYAKYRNSTELSKCIWKLKVLNMTPKISWEIAALIRC